MATTITLVPYAQGTGSGAFDNWEIVDAPTQIGDASLTDGSDATGYTIGGEFDINSNHHGEPVAAWFQTPGGFTPNALLLQIRARSNSQALGGIPSSVRELHTRLLSSDASVMYDFELTSPGSAIVSPLLDATATTTTDFTFWAGDSTVDLSNPTDVGGWYVLDRSYSGSPGDRAALMGGGLRVELGIYYSPSAGSPHMNFLDLFEVRLIVSGDYASAPAPLRLYPGPSTSNRLYPRPLTRRPGNF